LTARKVFEEIQLGFLLEGHTHEDINGYFNYVSDVLQKNNTFVLSDLIKHFMDSQKLCFMPHVVQEVVDFKSFVKSYALPLEGMKDIHIFRFFVDHTGWLVFQYKAFATDADWLPQGLPHHIWRVDSDRRPVTPVGIIRTLHLFCFGMESAPHCYGGRPPCKGWGTLPIVVEAALDWRMGSAPHRY
jgi:hypothetical protein